MAQPTNHHPSTTPVDPSRYVRTRRPDGHLVGRRRALAHRRTASACSARGCWWSRGRRSGEPRSVPVNLLELDGERYLVAPRGNTQWVRNARAAGVGELHLGRRTEQVELVEVPVGQRVPVLRVYLTRWGWEVGRFVEGLSKSRPTPRSPRSPPACRSSTSSAPPDPSRVPGWPAPTTTWAPGAGSG